MAKKNVRTPVVNNAQEQEHKEAMRQEVINLAAARFLMGNTTLLRREVLERFLTNTRDIDKECGYPVSLGISDYKAIFDRHGFGTRVVEIWPQECWSAEPEIYETDEKTETEFEKSWQELLKSVPVWAFLQRADVLSGIGQYGIVLLGVNDGKPLNEALDGVEQLQDVQPVSPTPRKRSVSRKLLFMRPFDQSVVRIESYEKRESNPRFGFPVMYVVKFETEPGSESIGEKRIHWTRVIHVADNRLSSEIFGVPRLQNVYNDLHNVRKVGGGGGEMFWRGGFPGFSFELQPEAAAAGAIIDKESVREQMEKWAMGLQRYMSVENLTTKSLQPQISDPTGHVKMYAQLIGIAKGIPWRMLLGTEEAKLASEQDKITWNVRLMRRQTGYLTPYLVRPVVDRLIAAGILPRPKEYFVDWPDLNAPSNKDKVEIAAKLTEAFAKYVAGGGDQLIPPHEYLTMVCGFSEEEAEAIDKAAEKYQRNMAAEEPEPAPGEPVPPDNPEDVQDADQE